MEADDPSMKRSHATAVAIANAVLFLLVFVLAAVAATSPGLVIAVGLPTVALHRLVTQHSSGDRHSVL